MTSKISLTNLRRENIKHRLGMILVTYFFFFLSVLAFLIQVQNTCSREDLRPEQISADITQLSYPEMGMGMLAMGAAVLLAISSFRYLHSKTEVDFYHSLPVRRREILYLLMTNDLVIFAAPLLFVLMFRCIVAAAAGYFAGAFLIHSLWSLICYTAVFAVVYLTMSMAMLMTGNTFIGLLGFCVFAGYSPVMLCYLQPSLANTFFKTYCGGMAHSALFDYFSPISLSNKLFGLADVWEWREHIVHLAVIGVWVAVLLVINYVLFEKRPSEMAGKAMAFPVWNPVIRFLLVVPAAVYVGLALYSVSFTSFKLWIIVGVVIGGFFAHGVIECIYRFDVRGLWSNKRQMLISIAAAFIIVGFFWADVSGYDSYIPAEKELASIGLENSSDNYFWGKERAGVSGDVMKGELAVLDKVVSENDENTDIYSDGSADETRGYESYVVRYKLKNGNEVRRQYIFSPELKDELMEQVYGTIEYKKDVYSLYTADWSLVTDIQLVYPGSSETLVLTKEQRTELFRCYLEDHAALDYKTAKTMLPFGQLTIMHKYAEDAAKNPYADIEDTDSYHLYPSFKKTIKYLQEELKIDLKTSMKDIKITALEVSRYPEGSDEQEKFEIYDEEFIESIKDRLCYGDEMWTNGMEAMDASVDLTATVLTDTGEESHIVYTDFETMEKIKKQGTFE